MKTYCFGVDIGGTAIKCGLFCLDGALVETWELPTNTKQAGAHILPELAASLKEKLVEHSIKASAVCGIGVGVPGPVNADGIVLCAVNLGWERKDVSAELFTLTGIPTKTANDANIAALGEAWKGAAKGADDVLLVTLGTSVGSGVIVDGRMLSGSHGAAGELGHGNVSREETEQCTCGGTGCLGQYASATGIVRLARQALEDLKQESLLRGAELSARAVFDAYRANDALAEAVVEQACEKLGWALAFTASVLDPQVIVLGGGVSKAGALLCDCVQKHYQNYAFSLNRNVPIVCAALGNDAGIYGAARLVLIHSDAEMPVEDGHSYLL